MITDCIGADTRSLHVNWLHCENGLPTEIISDRGKLFLSKFWRALHKLTNVSLKMSSAYHPETDGTSERTTPSINAFDSLSSEIKAGLKLCLGLLYSYQISKLDNGYSHGSQPETTNRSLVSWCTRSRVMLWIPNEDANDLTRSRNLPNTLPTRHA